MLPRPGSLGGGPNSRRRGCLFGREVSRLGAQGVGLVTIRWQRVRSVLHGRKAMHNKSGILRIENAGGVEALGVLAS